MADIADIISAASLPEREVDICVDGSLAAEHERLDKAIKIASEQPASMGEKSERMVLAEQITDLEEQMKEHVYTFRFRGLPSRQYSDLVVAHAPRKGHDEVWNIETFPPALIAACAVEPPMTVQRADELLNTLNVGQANILFEAALAVNTGKFDVPFSAAAYATLRVTAAK